MSRLNWDRAKAHRPTEQAFPTDKLGRGAARMEKRWTRKMGLTDELAARELGAESADPTPPKGQARKMTDREIDSFKTRAGGFSRESFAKLGIPYPPPKGWRQALLAGRPISTLAPNPKEARTGDVPRAFTGPTTVTDYPSADPNAPKAPWED